MQETMQRQTEAQVSVFEERNVDSAEKADSVNEYKKLDSCTASMKVVWCTLLIRMIDLPSNCFVAT